MLFLKVSAAVVEVPLVVWKTPEEPKLAPDDVAFRKIVLKETSIVDETVVEVTLIPLRGEVPPVVAGVRRSPIRLLKTLMVVPPETLMPFTEPPALLFSKL